jgi:hypothetical protein
MSTLAPILQSFFTDRLYRQLQASTHTIRLPGRDQDAGSVRCRPDCKSALQSGHC